MKNILVPTDFSANADRALDFAVKIAQKLNAKIIIVHACDLLELTFKDRVELKKEYNQNIIKEAKEKLLLYRDSIMKSENIMVQTKLYEGMITETILYAAKEQKADLIIMGTLGSTGLKEKILGSKTSAVIGKSAIPVLAVPLMSEWKEPEKICLALNNFKEATMDVIQPALSLVKSFNAELQIAKFTDTDRPEISDHSSVEKEGNSYAEKLQLLLKKKEVSFIHLTGSQFNKIMDSHVSDEKVDILAMITHKRNSVKAIFHRSMARKMSYHINVPLLVLPA